jgi:hypothetical protein
LSTKKHAKNAARSSTLAGLLPVFAQEAANFLLTAAGSARNKGFYAL